MNQGGIKPGNWGNSYIIITPILYKRVSCATCIYFSLEDGGCNKTAIYPPEYKYQYWKKCKEFDLDPEYMDFNHKNQVKRVKGETFFSSVKECKKKKVISNRINHTIDKNESVQIRVHKKLENLFQMQFSVCDNPEKNIVILHNQENGISAVIIKKFPSRGVKQFNKWEMECLTILRHAIQLQKQEKKFNQQLVIMPPCRINEEETLAEIYYKKQGHSFKGIHLVEFDENNNIVIASGPTERYWTPEKINNLHIFKEN